MVDRTFCIVPKIGHTHARTLCSLVVCRSPTHQTKASPRVPSFWFEWSVHNVVFVAGPKK